MTSLSDTSVLKYLALGDSYTIGEGVLDTERFPNQAVKILKNSNIEVAPPVIVAKTGWTTIELNDYLDAHPITETFDMVTLCIGVNDQFRGINAESYRPWFTQMLQRAIGYAGGRPERVVVLSIPDWGVTPFAENRDRDYIAGEIDKFNEVNKSTAKKFKTKYLDITADSRDVMLEPQNLLAPDKLHYSGQEMGMWAARLSGLFKAMILPPGTY